MVESSSTWISKGITWKLKEPDLFKKSIKESLLTKFKVTKLLSKLILVKNV